MAYSSVSAPDLGPWGLVANQAVWWVPLAGWETWASTLDLNALEPGVEKLEVSSMSDAHANAAAALLMEQLVSHMMVGAVMARMERLHLEEGGVMPESLIDQHELIQSAASAPLVLVLSSRPQKLVNSRHPALLDLLSHLDSGLHPSLFDPRHDALVAHLARRAAATAGHDLLSVLLKDKVPLPVALELVDALDPHHATKSNDPAQ